VFHGECDAPRLSHYFLPRLVREGKQILFLDGANCANPRLMARLAERRGIPFAEFNRHVRLSRAFTCFQLTELIRRVPRFLAESPAQVLIVTAFPELYFDEDVRDADARAAFQQALADLRRWAGQGQGDVKVQVTGKNPSPGLLRRPPSPARGEGWLPHLVPTLSPCGREWPAAGVLTSRSGPGEGDSNQHDITLTESWGQGAQDLTVAVFSCAANFQPPAGRKPFFAQTCAASTELWKFQVEEQQLRLLRQDTSLLGAGD